MPRERYEFNVGFTWSRKGRSNRQASRATVESTIRVKVTHKETGIGSEDERTGFFSKKQDAKLREEIVDQLIEDLEPLIKAEEAKRHRASFLPYYPLG